MYTLVTSRFTNDTLEINRNYKRKKNITGCIYGSPQEMSQKILNDSLVFVIEMNNDTDTIEGIGLVRNKPYLDKYYRIYDHGDYNRFVYKSNYRIDRTTLWEHNRVLVKVLEYVLFGEKTHLKRGSGFTTVTQKLFTSKKDEKCKKLVLYKIVNVIVNCFKKHYLFNHDLSLTENDNINNNYNNDNLFEKYNLL
jgi:hypothetical protein